MPRARPGHTVGAQVKQRPYFLAPHSYHRKLRAIKAAKEARKTAAGVMPPASAIPGTNMYTTER